MKIGLYVDCIIKTMIKFKDIQFKIHTTGELNMKYLYIIGIVFIVSCDMKPTEILDNSCTNGETYCLTKCEESVDGNSCREACRAGYDACESHLTNEKESKQ